VHNALPRPVTQIVYYLVVITSLCDMHSKLLNSTNLCACQKFSFRCISDDDFWRAAKTGDDRAGVLLGKRPRPAADAQVLLLAGSQHRCSVDRAEALKV